MRIIIFGANGYIGRHLSRQLYNDNISIRLYDIHTDPTDPVFKPFYSRLDILESNSLHNIDLDVDLIFIFSGLTGAFKSFEKYKDFINVNEIGLLNLLDCTRGSGSRAKLVFPSSRLVYKGVKNTKLKEVDELEFKTLYALNKFSVENYLKIFHNSFDINYIIFRIGVPYGSFFGDYSYGTTGSFIKMAEGGNNITLYGDGSQRRTFTHIEDICNIMIKASISEDIQNGVYNIGGEDFSLKQIADLIASVYSVNVKFIEWPETDLKIESGDTVFDSSKLDKITAPKYRYDIRSWIQGMGINK